MMAFLRMIALVIVIELIFYVLLGIYLRSTKREELEKEWDRRHPDYSGDSPARRVFVRRSMLGFNRTLKARLAKLVLILPVVAIVLIVILVNYN
ncbi:hypothetical protein [Paracoccus shanxieyensis]|uniref:Uncharacterized protein n=1 Tax=Paracoccus shanxieyensis TaxID=2675752 RepID=A0A6L6IW09_9RHOB|nr:hypothetical protein [Paracoccus shanxieyensis]MTH64686.1 hypothetical protein [Paracoccus shanxieyensis]MTH87830.1 hypothetical protein [Paracoccus shanxieyensis]